MFMLFVFFPRLCGLLNCSGWAFYSLAHAAFNEIILRICFIDSQVRNISGIWMFEELLRQAWMYQAGFFDKIGIENVVANLDDALARAKVLLR